MDSTTAQNHFELEKLLSCSIPTSRVKKICRLDPDLSMIGNDAVMFITKATELFVTELAKASYTQAVLEKRKTIQTKDLNRAIATKSMFDFLEDTLTGWPEREGVPQVAVNLEESAIEEDDIIGKDIEDMDDDVQVVDNSLTNENPGTSQSD